MDRQEIIAVLDRVEAGRHAGSDTAEVRAYRETLADALMQLETQPIASRDALARVLDPDIFDESKKRSKHPAAVIQIAARQHMAYEGADRLLAAGVFRQPPTRDEVIAALGRPDGAHNLRQPPSRTLTQAHENLYGRYADAVLNLLGGGH